MAGTGENRRFALRGAMLAVALVGSAAAMPAAASATGTGGAAPGAAVRISSPSSATSAHDQALRITSVSCTPEPNCSANPHQVSTHGRLLIAGKGLGAGMVIAFPRAVGARISASSPGAHLHRASAGLAVTVPGSAHSGRIMVLLANGRHSSSYGPIYVFRHALHPPPKPVPAAPVTAVASSPSPFEGQGMWIWYVSRSDGGSVASIIAQAHAAGVGTLFIKSSDGSANYWSQFSAQLVAELHANGIKVCAWQYVYGSNPAGEAGLGARAVAAGADCLVIDAEAEYEGHYAAAQEYIADLRARIGAAYPLAIASFPYVSYHPSLPYSVFLGPGGAQYDMPQMYWKDIGNSVDTVYANTYIGNRVYGRPIFPLGQTFGHVSAGELVRFREEASDYGASGISFWDWQETDPRGWLALAEPLTPLTSVTANAGYSELRAGAQGEAGKGDQVLWMQEHLAGAIPAQETTGIFKAQTAANVQSFQLAHGIAPSGVVEAATWTALLAVPPVAVDWTGGGPKSG